MRRTKLSLGAGLPDVPALWRNEALYRKGKVFQAQAKPAEAITAFYDVLERSTASADAAEAFWFYKAGSEAALMLEDRRDWKGAIAIYRKMAQLEGPRTAELKAKIARLQLEHFIWEE